MLLVKDVTSKALLSFPALDHSLIFDTLGYICDFTSDTADLCVGVDALLSVFFSPCLCGNIYESVCVWMFVSFYFQPGSTPISTSRVTSDS